MLRAFSGRLAGAIACRRRLPDRRGRRRRRDLRRMAGGGGRTRTYEGLASGFTVRPLCHSGHSPMSAEIKSRGQKRPGLAEAGCGKAYVASRLGLSTGNMTLIRRRVCGASMLREPRQASAHPTERALFCGGLGDNRRLATLRSPPEAQYAPTSEISNATPSPISTASRPCAPSAAGRRSSPRQDRRRDSPPHRPRSGHRFRDRRRPRRFR